MLRLAFALFLTGIALGAGPCLASCGPMLISYTAATKKGIKDSLRLYLIFSLSRIFVYLILGLVVGLLSQVFLLGSYQQDIAKFIYLIGGGFIFLLGLLIMLGREPRFKFCQVLRNNFIEKDAKSIFVFGLVVGISPCAPLIAVLSYIGLASLSWFKGALLSLSFGLGTVISPLVLLVIFAGFINKLFKQNEHFYALFQKICGAILCFLGLHLFITTLYNKFPGF